MTLYRQVPATNEPIHGQRRHAYLRPASHLETITLHATGLIFKQMSWPFDACLLQQVIERGMHSGEGIQGCSIYTGTGGVAYMFLRLAESLRHTQSLIAQHPKQPLAKLTPECLLRRAEEYGHWANHLSHRHTKVLHVDSCICF